MSLLLDPLPSTGSSRTAKSCASKALDAPTLLVAMVEDANSARDARILAARDGDVVTLTPSEEVPDARDAPVRPAGS